MKRKRALNASGEQLSWMSYDDTTPRHRSFRILSSDTQPLHSVCRMGLRLRSSPTTERSGSGSSSPLDNDYAHKNIGIRPRLDGSTPGATSGESLLSIYDHLIPPPQTKKDRLSPRVARVHRFHPVLTRDITDRSRIPLRADINSRSRYLEPLRASSARLISEYRSTRVFAEGLCRVGVDNATRDHPTS